MIDAGWRAAALDALRERDPLAKADAVRALQAMTLDAASQGVAHWGAARTLAAPPDLPGRPPRPELVEPRSLQRRSMSTPQGRVVLLHALAHIEFNAINLALDAVWRFPNMPDGFYADWLRVAAEEAYHFSLLRQRLADYGHAYGDFPAHNGLWEMCERTSGDVLARMALVPRVLEARGLDASPPIRARLKQAGDEESARRSRARAHRQSLVPPSVRGARPRSARGLARACRAIQCPAHAGAVQLRGAPLGGLRSDRARHARGAGRRPR
jgi:uncharacterized ferritin-like protein (DUF455 family)